MFAREEINNNEIVGQKSQMDGCKQINKGWSVLFDQHNDFKKFESLFKAKELHIKI